MESSTSDTNPTTELLASNKSSQIACWPLFHLHEPKQATFQHSYFDNQVSL